MKYTVISSRIKEALADNGMIPQDLADKAHIGKASVSHYVNGTHKPSDVNAKKMAHILNVDPYWLMGYDVPKDPFQSASDQLSAAANFFDLCLGRIGWTREWDDDKGKYAFRKNDVVVYFSADEYAELSDGIEKSVEDTILSAIREKIIK